MKEKGPNVIRMELAEGHWGLGEHDEALACIERIEGEQDAVRELLGRMLEAEEAPEAAGRLRQVLADLSPRPGPTLATRTLAELLEKQGHEDEAVRVAENVLRRHPEDERARAVLDRLGSAEEERDHRIATLERWLDYFQRRGQGEARP